MDNHYLNFEHPSEIHQRVSNLNKLRALAFKHIDESICDIIELRMNLTPIEQHKVLMDYQESMIENTTAIRKMARKKL